MQHKIEAGWIFPLLSPALIKHEPIEAMDSHRQAQLLRRLSEIRTALEFQPAPSNRVLSFFDIKSWGRCLTPAQETALLAEMGRIVTELINRQSFVGIVCMIAMSVTFWY